MKPLPAQPVIDWLSRQPGFQDLASHTRHLASLQADVDRCAPLKGLTVNSLEADVLVLSTRNAAMASKLRQFEPSLLAGLTRSGWKVSRIRIRPQPQRAADDPVPVVPRPKETVPLQALQALDTLREGTEEGQLKRALTNLLLHQRQRKQPR